MVEKVTRNPFEDRSLEESKNKSDRLEVVIKLNGRFGDVNADTDIRLFEREDEFESLETENGREPLRQFHVYMNEDALMYTTRGDDYKRVPIGVDLFVFYSFLPEGRASQIFLWVYDEHPMCWDFIKSKIFGYKIKMRRGFGDEEEDYDEDDLYHLEVK